MTFQTLLQALSGSALDTLAGFDRRAALDAGLDPARVRAWAGLYDVYFAPTHSRQKQRQAAEKARRRGFSLDQLALIERRLKPVKSARTRAKLRLQLLDAQGDYQALARLAKRLVPGKKKPRRSQVRFSRSRDGKRTMTVTADERDLADLEHAVSREIDPSKPAAPQMLKAFLDLMRGDGTGVPRAVPRPLLLIPLPEWTKIIRGDGDETILGLTDGTTVTGAEFLQRYATEEYGLEAATFHPKEGAVNLYRTKRLANQKQRDLVRATQTVCPVPDCRCAADMCEIHHVKAWSRGGETNLDNLAVLCRYHNRMNDDDPAHPRRGRIEIIDGAPVWRSPRGYAVANEHHPYGAMQTLFT
ncbi:HNH endonuclease [Corynebacterium yudongzhengii]|uniref:HNH endonuclease n=1 Tax=Corynebacterium yudongzhengii TaxID=2080740 RepID=A0A2U1T754_9CORY|nr:HNH endonuclease signature motif containing protein [Corynebacterium yudongzhengii]AWB81362.1 HNH endonuclease [Corynebacterium yudongzhengii]PWC01805.1 HNH endonuclease [Corynebacterium yudongzhengii]